MTDDAQDRLLNAAMKILVEHFDTVQIICTVDGNRPGMTTMRDKGAGNAYGRVGSVRDWLLREDAETQQRAIREMGDEDGDHWK